MAPFWNVSTQSNMTMLDCALSANSTPLMKMLVPPPKDAHGMPLASSDANSLPLETWSSCSLYPIPSIHPSCLESKAWTELESTIKLMEQMNAKHAACFKYFEIFLAEYKVFRPSLPLTMSGASKGDACQAR